MSKPLLSIASITYNHGKYVAEALDSWLMQQTDFDYEIVIGEDCSKDNTKEIIESYIEKYPAKINLIDTGKNVGMMPNFLRTLKSCKGKYIAICEGDDYWTDPLKLQKQVDFLEKNEDFSMCFHPVKIKMSDGKLVDDFVTRSIPEITGMKELLEDNYIHTASVVFRNNFFKKTLPENFVRSPLGDYYLHIFNSQFGKIKKLSGVMGVYRFGDGVWASKDVAYKQVKTIKALSLIFEEYSKNTLVREKWYEKLISLRYKDYKDEITLESDFENYLLSVYSPEHICKNVPLRDLVSALIKRLRLSFIMRFCK